MDENGTIGPYQIIRSIGKGGMGEVLLAFDPFCKREIALKRIRNDLKSNTLFKNRFLREARITAQLTHPGIISIFSISNDEEIYYTMPYVEGMTLKQLLQKKEDIPIAKFLPIFKSICQTVAYAHSKGIIHRDLKPENMLVGNFGEVILLDWGLAETLDEVKEELDHDIKELHPDLTHPGKIVGTLAYMAPERAFGNPANMQTDIYSLGVILYQILTLHLPFNRGTMKEFQKSLQSEKLTEPEEMAPYRDVPPTLSRIVKKALHANATERYHSMEPLIEDLLNHMEGRSGWFESKSLQISKKRDWEWQENVLVSKHVAVTRTLEEGAWLSIMLSKSSFSENIRLETKVCIGNEGEGIGFLLNVPEQDERDSPLSGYCLWLGVENSQLFRNTVEALHVNNVFLTKNKWHTIAIEKNGNHINFFLDGQLKFNYVSYIPLVGTHVGVVSRDADFEIDKINVFLGGQDLTVSCLSIPDAFLSSKDYKRALAEYRRIGYSFPGHAEGREALFRAGITLLEQAKTSRSEKRRELYYSLALDEFSKLHNTPGAPLEYLGKALVYQTLGEPNEEIKCLELALRRYSKHPLVSIIKEQILYRMYESSQTDRRSAYRLILISLRQIEDLKYDSLLFKHLLIHSEPLPFLENPIEPSLFGKEKSDVLSFATIVAFWLANPHALLEIFEDLLKLDPLDMSAIGNLLYCLFDIGAFHIARKLMNQLKNDETLSLLEPIAICHEKSLQEGINNFFSKKIEDIGVKEFRTLSYLLQFALRTSQEKEVETIAERILPYPLSREDRILLDAYRIWAFLAQHKWKEAEAIFDTYSLELLNQESTLLHPLYGCFLYATEGEELASIHFAGVIDTPFPRSWALLGHELTNQITKNPAWYETSFMVERRQLYRQLVLYYQCANNEELASYYRNLEKQEYLLID